MKYRHLLAGILATFLFGCVRHPDNVITISLETPPLKNSPTEKPFPAYTNTLNYLKSPDFKRDVAAALSSDPKEVDIKIETYVDTTLFRIDVTVIPDQPLESISKAIKSVIDSFGATQGSKFVIYNQAKG